MALADPENRPLIERDLQYAFWNNHCLVDAAIGTFIEYGTKVRRKNRESYAEMWRRWIYDDYYRSYLLPLEKYGLKIHHEDIEEAWNRIRTRVIFIRQRSSSRQAGSPTSSVSIR